MHRHVVLSWRHLNINSMAATWQKSLFLFAVWSHNMCHCTNGYKITWLHYQYVIIQTHNSAPWFLWEKDCTLYKLFAVSALDNIMMWHNGVMDEHLSDVKDVFLISPGQTGTEWTHDDFLSGYITRWPLQTCTSSTRVFMSFSERQKSSAWVHRSHRGRVRTMDFTTWLCPCHTEGA